MGEAERVLTEARTILEESSRCGICLEVYSAPHRIGCGHIFCGLCLAGWTDRNSTCPSCRKGLHDVQADLGVGNLVEGLALLLLDKKAKEEWMQKKREWEHQKVEVYRRWSHLVPGNDNRPYPVRGDARPLHQTIITFPDVTRQNDIAREHSLQRFNRTLRNLLGLEGDPPGPVQGEDGISEMPAHISDNGWPGLVTSREGSPSASALFSDLVESEEAVSSPPNFRPFTGSFLQVPLPSSDSPMLRVELGPGVGASHPSNVAPMERVVPIENSSIYDHLAGTWSRLVSVEAGGQESIVATESDPWEMLQTASTNGFPSWTSVEGPQVVDWSRASTHQGAEVGESPTEPIDLVSDSEGDESPEGRTSQAEWRSLQESIVFARDHFEQVSRILESSAGHLSESRGNAIGSHQETPPPSLTENHPWVVSVSGGVSPVGVHDQEDPLDGFEESSEGDLEEDEMDFSDDDDTGDERSDGGVEVENEESHSSQPAVQESHRGMEVQADFWQEYIDHCDYSMYSAPKFTRL